MTDCILPKKLESPHMLGEISSHMSEATDGCFKLLVGAMEKCSRLDKAPGY